MPQIAGIAYRHKAPDAESTAQIASAERQADLGWDRMEDFGLVSKLGPAAQAMRGEKGINLIEIAYHFGRSESALSKHDEAANAAPLVQTCKICTEQFEDEEPNDICPTCYQEIIDS